MYPEQRWATSAQALDRGEPASLATLARQPGRRRVALVVEHRYLVHAQPAGLQEALRAAGHEVHLLVTDPAPATAPPLDWTEVDVAVARGRGPQLLALLQQAAAAGVPTVNPVASIAAVLDKQVMGHILEETGLPIPVTRCGSPADLADAAWRFPVICKPVRGDNARGIRVVDSARDLALLGWPEPVAVVQEFLPGDGRDLKLYGAGSAVWAVRRPSPLLVGADDFPEPVPVTPLLRSLALKCADAFGLRLYGVDCLLTPEGPVVLEVNDYPNYTGVDGASDAIAELVTGSTRRVRDSTATHAVTGNTGTGNKVTGKTGTGKTGAGNTGTPPGTGTNPPGPVPSGTAAATEEDHKELSCASR